MIIVCNIIAITLNFILLERYNRGIIRLMEKQNVNCDLVVNFYDKIKSGELPRIFEATLPIAIIQKTLFSNSEEYFKEHFGILTSEVDVLAALYTHSGTLTPTQLYDLTIFSSGGMTKVLKRLEERNYIYRKQDEKDRRCMLVCITKDGEDLIKKALDGISKECELYFATLSKDELSMLNVLLKKVLYSLNSVSK